MHLVGFVGTVAVALSLLFVWPQVIRVARTRDLAGVSATGAVWAGVGFSLWSVYGIEKGLAPVVVANLQSLVGFGAVVLMAARWGPAEPAVRWMVPASALGVAAAAAALPATAIGFAAVLIGATAYLPQLRVALGPGPLTGISTGTYVLVALCSATWAIYGVVSHSMLVTAPNLLIVPTAVLVASRSWRDATVDGELGQTAAAISPTAGGTP